MGHIHAAAMAEYAKDAAETDKPWERWEFSYKNQEYESLNNHPIWMTDNKYRRKPKVILINGHEVPEPCRTPLKDGEVYWTLSSLVILPSVAEMIMILTSVTSKTVLFI